MKTGPILWLYDAGMSLVVTAVLVPFEMLKRLWGITGSDELDQRLGRYPAPARSSEPRILIHAVSAGEMAAAGALITAVGAIDARVKFVVTTGNRAGRAVAACLARSCPSIEMVAYLPWDRFKGMRRFLQSFRLDMVVLVEAELWPNLLRVCGANSIPVIVVNGRIGARDVARYRLVSGVFTDLLRAVEWVGVVGEEDRRAYTRIGTAPDHIEVKGNLKIDAPVVLDRIPCEWVQVFDERGGPLVVAGSTHPGEHRYLLETFRRLREDFADLRLIVAPRNPKVLRPGDVGSGLHAVCWSAGPCSSWDVLIVDAVGVLGALYRWADVAFIGGSLVDRGGHNPIEAASAGKAVVMGPFFANFREIVEGLRDGGAIEIVAKSPDRADALHDTIGGLLADPKRRSILGARARRHLERRRGVADRYARRLLRILSRGASNGRASTGTGPGSP